VSDDPTTHPEPTPSEPKLGIAGRIAERIFAPLLEKPGKRANDYRRADTATRSVLALVAALAGFGYLIRWQAQDRAVADEKRAEAQERMLDRMISSTEQTSIRNNDAIVKAIDKMTESFDKTTTAMKAMALERDKVKR
jgi:uncharacterized protein HemX